jgi:hypothetical protein
MKKILLITSIIISISSFAQRTPLNNLMNISLPEKSEKITNAQLLVFVKDKLSYSQLKDKIDSNDYYKINTMILELIAFKGTQKANYLEETQKGLYGLSNIGGSLSTNYTSEIKMFNNYRVLVTHWEAQYYAYYSFICISNSNIGQLNGTLNYDKTDKSNRDNAIRTLDIILQNMTFK